MCGAWRPLSTNPFGPLWARSAGGEAIAFLELLSTTEHLRPFRVPPQPLLVRGPSPERLRVHGVCREQVTPPLHRHLLLLLRHRLLRRRLDRRRLLRRPRLQRLGELGLGLKLGVGLGLGLGLGVGVGVGVGLGLGLGVGVGLGVGLVAHTWRTTSESGGLYAGVCRMEVTVVVCASGWAAAAPAVLRSKEDGS